MFTATPMLVLALPCSHEQGCGLRTWNTPPAVCVSYLQSSVTKPGGRPLAMVFLIQGGAHVAHHAVENTFP